MAPAPSAEVTTLTLLAAARCAVLQHHPCCSRAIVMKKLQLPPAAAAAAAAGLHAFTARGLPCRSSLWWTPAWMGPAAREACTAAGRHHQQ